MKVTNMTNLEIVINRDVPETYEHLFSPSVEVYLDAKTGEFKSYATVFGSRDLIHEEELNAFIKGPKEVHIRRFVPPSDHRRTASVSFIVYKKTGDRVFSDTRILSYDMKR